MADTHASAGRIGSMAIIERDFYDHHSEEKILPLKASRSVTPQQSIDLEPPNPKQPAGVRQMEAITLVWTKKWLITAYVL